MNSLKLITRRHLTKCSAMICLAFVLAAGCASERETHVPTSGDPQADQRAEMRTRGETSQGRPELTLYERLGGNAGISALVDDMSTRVIADPRVNFERRDVRTGALGTKYKAWDPNPENVENFKRHMVEFLILATGGPAEYTGRDMATVHKGMKITNNEFDAMVGDIKASMDRLRVAAREKRDLLAIIETTRKQIVEQQ